ncbi:hypothetical protein UFOVP340_59 [uncultured Caudovirales phage]|uniref:Uncharacterized protein n=1 Tax=uncultured Caudovirales phage TaxID=2100421 RepID=A0A6J5M0D4_9CAUD|nr:hypothetical protein UFOVP340_59 [uncultured Caudovirales phage]
MKLPILEDVPDDLPIVDKCLLVARNLGKEAGANCAEWVAMDTFGGRCTRDHKAKARAVLESIESCDYSHMDVRLPNLSGEYADEMTPAKLLEDVMWYTDAERGEHTDEVEVALDDLCNEWEQGVGEGYEWQLAQLAKSAME